MSNLSQFISASKVGDVCQSPVNINDPNWMRMDGSILVRANYPVFSGMSGNVGVFTPTIRSTTAIPSQTATVVSNSTVSVANGNSGNPSNLLYSTNGGVNWTSGGSGAGNYAFSNLVWNGTVFVAGTGTANASAYSTNGQNNWSAAGGNNTYINSMAANTSNGTVVAIQGTPVSGTVQISTNASTPSFSILTMATGTANGVLANCVQVYTGTQFMIFGYTAAGQGYQYSSTGASGTWTGVSIPPWGDAIVNSVASDGAGNVVIGIGGTSIAYASTNGGVTWRQTLLPGNLVYSTNSSMSCANGKFFAALMSSNASSLMTNGDMAVSSDLLSWTYIPALSASWISTNANYYTQVAYQGSNYIFVSQGASSLANSQIITATEDTTKMYLPTSRRQTAGTAILFNNGAANYQEWIKVQ